MFEPAAKNILRVLGIAGAALLVSASLEGPLSASTPSPPPETGILVMAHGGTLEWNEAVERALEPLRATLPAALAFGMADRQSLQDAVARLESQGVRQIAVVRLFVSAESFRQQTEYFLGLREDPPNYFLLHGGHGTGAHGKMEYVPSRQRSLPPIRSSARLCLNREGLYDASEMARVMVSRALDLSRNPARESVLVLAHGEGDDHLNSRWLERLDRLAAEIRQSAPYRQVRVETLREDWHDKRGPAEERIRSFVAEQGRDGSVIVVPFRVFGFGPYREVLEGLDYVADGRGLLPSPLVSEWIRRQAEECFRREGWTNPFAESPSAGK